jgi:CHAT domain-containing protein
LVVLSACDTGLTELRSYDETVGMPAVFMSLGAGGVLATLWPIDDRATALLISRFYELHLGPSQLSPPAALRRAVSWLRKGTNGEFIAYLDKAVRRGHLQGSLAETLQNSLRRSAVSDARNAHVQMLAQRSQGSSTTTVSAASSQTQLRDRPFSHPYYWGAFTYTGF